MIMLLLWMKGRILNGYWEVETKGKECAKGEAW